MDRKLKYFLTVTIICLLCNSSYSQNYADIKIKEEFDLLNTKEVTNINMCYMSSDDDEEHIGDALCYVLDGYITMYKTTKDKAYLYKFIFQTIQINKIFDLLGEPRPNILKHFLYELYLFLVTITTAMFFISPFKTRWKGRSY